MESDTRREDPLVKISNGHFALVVLLEVIRLSALVQTSITQFVLQFWHERQMRIVSMKEIKMLHFALSSCEVFIYAIYVNVQSSSNKQKPMHISVQETLKLISKVSLLSF